MEAFVEAAKLSGWADNRRFVYKYISVILNNIPRFWI